MKIQVKDDGNVRLDIDDGRCHQSILFKLHRACLATIPELLQALMDWDHYWSGHKDISCVVQTTRDVDGKALRSRVEGEIASRSLRTLLIEVN